MTIGLPGFAKQDSDAGAPLALTIDVVSDVVCPWCFIGKRQLERALARWSALHPEAPEPKVRWRPFQLNPAMPASGMPREDYLRRKFGSADLDRLYANVRRAAADAGLALNLSGIVRQPNTLRAHALLEAAAQAGCQGAVAEALFAAYFVEGRDLTDDAVLAQLAAEAGLPRERAEAALADPEAHRRVAEADEQAREAGIGGVPFFIVNGRAAVNGAQGEAALLRAFERALGLPHSEAALPVRE